MRYFNPLARPSQVFIAAPFCRMIANDMYSYAFIGLAISGATDWVCEWQLRLLCGIFICIQYSVSSLIYLNFQLDGYMARKMGINSIVGSYLDPLADKVCLCILYNGISICSISSNPPSCCNCFCNFVTKICLVTSFGQVLIGCVVLAMVDKDLIHRK